MITRDEIDAKAQWLEMDSTNVERDYVFGWLLFGLFTVSPLKDQLFLKGGNALRKGYFENTRFSGDLDFGMTGDIPESTLFSELNKLCDFIREAAGIDFLNGENVIKEKFSASDAPLTDLKVYEVRLYFRDFYGKRGSMKIRISMDITRFDKVLLPIQSRPLIHPYSDTSVLTCEIRCMKLEEIVATKLKCLIQRQHAPDLFDYAYSIRLLGGELDKQQVLTTLIQKTIFSRNPFILKGILQRTAFSYFREEWNKSIICAKQLLMNVEDAITAFLGDLEGLFAGYPDNGYAQFTYFNADQRTAIMHAGRTQTLLKIRYSGEDRIVEPYSLKYQMRRDGVAREYFFAHKVSGGSSAPGIKMFTADRMQSVDNTEQTFEPQYQIEMSKAGEMPEKPYLFDPNKPLRAPKRTTRTRYVGPRLKYIYRCSYCGKQFTKTTQSSALGAHKTKGGNACGGRSGYFVESRYS
jgi:predicted nucleotidyltransferase component of viral defense system